MAPTGELLRQYIEGSGLPHPSKSRNPLFGHSDISMTEIHARTDETMKRKALLEAYESPTEDKLPEWKNFTFHNFKANS